MTVSTQGLDIQSPSRALRAAVELLSSMRFAISLLTIICIASVIGTVVKQNEPFNNYVNQFGPFWAEVFDHVGLYTVYSAWWFLLILGLAGVPACLFGAASPPPGGPAHEELPHRHHQGRRPGAGGELARRDFEGEFAVCGQG